MNLTPESEPTPAEPIEPDQALLTAHDLAIAALSEITAASTIGEPADYRVEADGVVSLRFRNRMPGYPGWLWTVSLARVEGAEPTVLEVELLPSDGALVAPEWVPWAVRLAEYHAAQEALAEEAPTGDGLDESEDSDLDDDLDDLDAADFDNDGSPILHAGDLDGVDIDELDEDAVDPEGEDSDDESDDDESDEDDSDEDDSESDDDEDDDSDDEDDESDDDDSDDDSESDEDADEDESDEDEDESESDSEDDSASDDNEEVASASDED
ncbi:DUF3027 domain-containing protein [Microbacterium sp. R86528]|uniref:DUF3027 domain-containing protein n=1 Tax=Microbacterium sp. R86528 TaxID=3093864 RepID=UPI0037C7193C